MIKQVAILGIGIAIGYYLLRPNMGSKSSSVIKSGDKSKDIEGMQKLFENIAGLKYDEYGMYDSDTKASAQYLLSGTSALKDGGFVDQEFVNNLAKIHNNSLKK